MLKRISLCYHVRYGYSWSVSLDDDMVTQLPTPLLSFIHDAFCFHLCNIDSDILRCVRQAIEIIRYQHVSIGFYSTRKRFLRRRCYTQIIRKERNMLIVYGLCPCGEREFLNRNTTSMISHFPRRPTHFVFHPSIAYLIRSNAIFTWDYFCLLWFIDFRYNVLWFLFEWTPRRGHKSKGVTQFGDACISVVMCWEQTKIKCKMYISKRMLKTRLEWWVASPPASCFW